MKKKSVWVKIRRSELEQMKQDIEDMRNSICTRFDRCDACGRVHDSNYICPYCKYDNSWNLNTRRKSENK